MGCGASKDKDQIQPSRAVRVEAQTASQQAPLALTGAPVPRTRAETQPLGSKNRPVPAKPTEVKVANPGFYGLHPAEEAKSSGQEDSMKAGPSKRTMQEDGFETSTSDAASLGNSNINTFDSLSHFETPGLSNPLATTFRRPNAGAHAEPPVDAVSTGSSAPAPAQPQLCQKSGRLGTPTAGDAQPNGSHTGSQRRMRESKHVWKGVSPLPATAPNAAKEERKRREAALSPMRSKIAASGQVSEGGSSSAESRGWARRGHRKSKKSWSNVQLSGDENPSSSSKARPRTPERQQPRRKSQAQKPEATAERAPKPAVAHDSDASSRRSRPSRPSTASPLYSVESSVTSENDASSIDGVWRSRLGKVPSGPQIKPGAEARRSSKQDLKSLGRGAASKPKKLPNHLSQSLLQRRQPDSDDKQPTGGSKVGDPGKRPEAQNPFAELVDTQASGLDQLLTTASMNKKPMLTTVIGNPLASNGSLTKEDMAQIEQYVQQQAADCERVCASTGPEGGSNPGGWTLQYASSAQQWRSLADPTPTPLLVSDAASDAATLGSLMNTTTMDVRFESQPSMSLKNWNASGVGASSTTKTSRAGSSRDSFGRRSDTDEDMSLQHAVTPTSLDVGEIKLNFDRYDNLGPLSDITTQSIAQGAMRLLRRRDSGKLFAGKFIPRPEGGILHKWHEREIINHRAVHGHPNVVGFRDLFLTDTHCVIVMDYASCGSLASLLKDRTTLPEAEAKRLFRQLVQGVCHCHSRGIFHRNLQLECILLDGNEGSPTLKIGGFSRSKSGNADSQPKSAVSRPPYTAPELLQGTFHKGDLSASHSGAPLDVWACGLVLYHMLYGFNPFQGNGKKRDGFSTQMMRRICSADFSFPDEPPDSTDCKDLIRKILVADPQHRLDARSILEHVWMTQPLPQEMVRQRQGAGSRDPQALEHCNIQRISTNARIEDDALQAVARSRRRRSLALMDRNVVH